VQGAVHTKRGSERFGVTQPTPCSGGWLSRVVVLGLGLTVKDFGSRVWGLGFGVWGFRFQVSGFGLLFGVSGFGFQVISGFGFRG